VLNARVAAGFAVAVAILLALGAVSYRSLAHLLTTDDQVRHTYAVISEIDTLHVNLLRAEINARALVVDGDPRYQGAYEAAVASIDEGLARLRILVLDNRVQQILGRLEAAIKEHRRHLAHLLDIARSRGARRPVVTDLTWEGNPLTGALDLIVRDLRTEELRLLTPRRQAAHDSAARTQWLLLLGSGVAVLLVGTGTALLHRGAVRRAILQQTLQEKEALYRATLSQFPNGSVLVFDSDLRYLIAEGRSLARVGLSKERLEGRTIHEALDAQTCRVVEPSYRAALQGQMSQSVVPYGGRTFNVIFSPIQSPDGTIRHGLVVTQDVTERHQAEEENRSLNQRLETIVADLKQTNEELEAFTYSVSHDLRAPLRHIGGFVELLQRHTDGRLDETGVRYLATIATAGRRMGQLVDDLLAFSRMSRTELQVASVALDPLVRGIIEEQALPSAGRAIEWTVGALPTVRADPAMLAIVMSNLIGNAVKYTRDRRPATIEIGASIAAGQTVIHVRDNGAGFDMRYADKLFGVFQRLHRSDEFEGTGIGLATVRRVVHRHGGRTWAEGIVDGGATFYFSLPEGAATQP
jgi:PAS domain S-box-containing protein